MLSSDASIILQIGQIRKEVLCEGESGRAKARRIDRLQMTADKAGRLKVSEPAHICEISRNKYQSP